MATIVGAMSLVDAMFQPTSARALAREPTWWAELELAWPEAEDKIRVIKKVRKGIFLQSKNSQVSAGS